MDSTAGHCGMANWAGMGWTTVLYGAGRVPLFWPDCRPLPGTNISSLKNRFPQFWTIIAVSSAKYIYLEVICMLPFAAFVCEGFSFIVFAISTRLSAMACQSLLLTIWRGAQRNVICHRFIPDEHVQAICSSLLVWSMIICFYLVCFLAKHFFKTNNQLDLL